MDEIGVKNRLRTALEAYNENPTSLAKKFGVNQKTLNNQINSDTAVSLRHIAAGSIFNRARFYLYCTISKDYKT